MDLFTYLLGKKGQNTQKDLFSYLLGKKSSTSGVYATYTGQTFNIANTLRAKIKNWILGGNTEQNIEPTPDNPQEIHIVKGNNNINISNKNILNINRILGEPSDTSFANTAKRLFNYNEFVLGITLNNYYAPERITNYSVNENSITLTTSSNAYGLGMAIKLKANTQYTLSYETSALASASSRVAFYEEDGTNIVNSGAASTSTNTYLTFTTPQNCFFAVIIFSPGTNVNVTYSNIQLEQGSTATEYTPHQVQNYPINLGNIELCKIGNYQDEIKASDGTNLFDKNNVNILNAFFASSAKKITTSQNAKIFYISCKPNTTYTISKIASQRFRVMTTETIPEIDVIGIDYAQKETGTYITITTSSNAHYLCVYYYLNGTDTLSEQEILNSIQVEYGSQVTEWQPYGKNTWYIKKNINKVILNGTESGFDTGGAGSTTYRTYLEDTTVAFNTTDEIKVLCNYLNGNTPDEIITNLQVGISTRRGTAQGFFMRVPTTIANDLTSFLQWLSEVNPIVYYVLATPIYIVITDTNLISQLNDLLNSRSYNDLTNIEQINEDLPFNISLDIKITSTNLGMNNSLNNSFLSNKTIIENENIEQDEIENQIYSEGE